MGTRAAEFESASVRASSSLRSIDTGLSRVSESFTLPDLIAFSCKREIPSCYSAVSMSAASSDATIEDRLASLLDDAHAATQSQPMEELSRGVAFIAAGSDPAFERRPR
jgi:hypothetical protein